MKYMYKAYGYIYISEKIEYPLGYNNIYFYKFTKNMNKSINLSKQEYYKQLKCTY